MSDDEKIGIVGIFFVGVALVIIGSFLCFGPVVGGAIIILLGMTFVAYSFREVYYMEKKERKGGN